MPAGPVLIVGAFPPVPGPVTAATVEVVRRQVAAGVDLRTAAVRPGGAQLVVRAAGPLAGWRLEQARVTTGACALVLALDDGVPARRPRPGGAGRWADVVAAHIAVRSLALAARRFDTTTVLVAADPGLPATVLSPLWSAADSVVVAGSAALAGALAVPARLLEFTDVPAPLRGLGPTGVTARGPAEVTPIAMPRYALGVAGRRVLGARFLPVYHRALRVQNRARGVAARARRLRRSPAR